MRECGQGLPAVGKEIKGGDNRFPSPKAKRNSRNLIDDPLYGVCIFVEALFIEARGIL